MSHCSSSRTILTLVGKDWRLFWADRRAAVLCFLVPIVLASAFGIIFHRPATDPTTAAMSLPVLLVVEDEGPFTASVAADLLSTRGLEGRTATRAQAMAYSFASTHLLLEVQGAQLLSLIEPPPWAQRASAECENVGLHPVIVSELGVESVAAETHQASR